MFRSLVLSIATTIFCLSAYGQTATGTIQGRVVDSSAATIPEAKVTVENARTGVRQEIVSNASGRFVLPYVQPGEYNISVEKTGFDKSVTNGVVLNNQQTVELDLTLKVGQMSTVVEVSADATQIATSTSTVTTNLTTKQLHELPTQGRNPFGFATLSSGVVPAGGGSTPWISGGRNSSSEILIDGNTAIVPENNVSINDGGYVPILDSVAEVTVIKNSLAAEYGRTGGGVISATTRGGTNELHFGLFEFFRNPKLNANSWNNNRNNVKRPVCCSRNEFGFNVGGPVILPGLYDGRNKTFFFWSHQLVRAPGYSTNTTTVPIAEWRAGNFSNLRNGQGQPITIYDPLTVDENNIRQPFPGNIIPRNRMDPVALKALEYFPLPNNVPTNSFTNANNYLGQGGTKSTGNKFDSRVDHNFSDKFRMFARGSYENSPGTPLNGFGNVGTSQGDGPNTNTFPNITANFVYTISPTTIFNTNLGFGQKDYTRKPFSNGFLPSTLGFPKEMDAIAALNNLEFPRIDTGSGTLGQAGFTTLDIKSYAYTSHSELVKVFSKHTIKGGFEYRKLLLNFTQYGNPAGNFGFGTSPTVRVVNQTNPTTEGFGFASFLLGIPNTGGSISHSFSAAQESPYVGVFFQDDWKISRRLTLNIGLRWDVDVPRTERYNRLNHFDLDAPSPLAGKVPGYPNLKGAYVFQTADDRRQVATDKNNWGPRFGFAYQFTEKTVFRGAYGVMYSASPFTAAGTSGSSGTQGFQSSTTMNVTNDNFRTIQNYLSNPFPNGYNLPLGAGLGGLTNVGIGVGEGVFIDNQNPMIQQWSANIQRELPGGIILEVGYLGSKGHHLVDGESNIPLTQLPANLMALGESVLNAQVPNPFYQVQGVNPTSQLFTNRTVQAKQLMTAYPQFTGVSAFRVPQGNSNYHSFTMEANKRYSNGLQLQVAFTGGKLIDDVSSTVGFQGATGSKQDYYNRRGDKSISAQDVSRRLVVAFNYDLPFGRNRAFLGELPKPVDFVLGGWQVNGISTYQTGTPLAITQANNNGVGAPGQRPNNNGKSAEKSGPIDQRLNSYFDQSVFSQAPNFTFGNTSRLSPDLRRPTQYNTDFSVFKAFRFRERLTTTFRAEAYNVFNHPTWDAPGTAVNNVGTFGIITGAGGNRTMQLALKVNY